MRHKRNNLRQAQKVTTSEDTEEQVKAQVKSTTDRQPHNIELKGHAQSTKSSRRNMTSKPIDMQNKDNIGQQYAHAEFVIKRV